MTTATRTTTTAPRWSARPFTDADLDAVLALFTEPDFHYRTHRPDTRPEWEILALLDQDTRLLLADGELVGLYAVETVGADHASHVELQLRLSARMAPDLWTDAYRTIVAALRERREVIRLAWHLGEFDERGLAAARAAGLTEEGTVAELVVHEGRPSGLVFFSQIWEPAS
jgi:hypothetical protein